MDKPRELGMKFTTWSITIIAKIFNRKKDCEYNFY